MNYVLLIIDMQTKFDAAHSDYTQSYCVKEIKKAIKLNAVVIFVEYNNSGDTVKLLTDVVKKAKYDKAFTIVKYDDDGSQVIDKFLKKKRFPRTHYRVCGVNTDACVIETVYGLSDMYSKKPLIEVVKKACNSQYCHQEGIDEMMDIKNVRIV
jgi:nicotinamidase-related amidase